MTELITTYFQLLYVNIKKAKLKTILLTEEIKNGKMSTLELLKDLV